mmetsp:Transcript_16439/g.46349  ORF Transcript_16439/g.46349 Transcript_16439/m.46349 type:complete len:189 (-) Transcript_16439:4675-5241(-)
MEDKEKTIEHSLDIEALAPRGRRQKWRCQVPSNVFLLSHISERNPWIPGRDNVRPKPEVRSQKEAYLEEVAKEYVTESDYVWNLLFGVPLVHGEDGRKRACPDALRNLEKTRLFRANDYPYDLHPSTTHSVLWYSYAPPELNSESITTHVEAELTTVLNHSDFEFVWYENPKMSISGVYHVQVFWRLL